MFRFFRRQKTKEGSGVGYIAAPSGASTNDPQLDGHVSALLARFSKPSNLHTKLMQSMWEEHLDVTYTSIIQRAIHDAELRSLTTEEALQLSTVKNLKMALTGNGLKASGRKQELIDRLLTNAPDVAVAEARKCSSESYILTEKGRLRVQQYEEVLTEVREQTKMFVRIGDLQNARIVAEKYKSLIPKPIRGGMEIGMSVDDPDDDEVEIYSSTQVRAQYLFESAASTWVGQEIPDAIRHEMICMAIDEWLLVLYRAADHVDPSWLPLLPRKSEIHFRLLSSLAANIEELESARSLGIKTIGIRTANDDHVCEVCAAFASKTYTLDQVPPLPHRFCTFNACRCSYELFFE